MLTGKYWITPEGVVDVSTSEHALHAKKIMLGLAPEDRTYNVRTMFTPLSAFEKRRFKELDVGIGVLDYLSKPDNDPRMFAIRGWKWIRTRQKAFHLWSFDSQTLALIRDSSEFWQAQRKIEPSDEIDVEQYAQAASFSVSVTSLLNPRCTIQEILRKVDLHSCV